jgi:arylsulfatase A
LMTFRSGDWRLITGLGSGGFSKPNRVKPAPDDPQGQLYNLASDLGETTNRYSKHPQIVARLTAELKTVVDDGRSRVEAASGDVVGRPAK